MWDYINKLNGSSLACDDIITRTRGLSGSHYFYSDYVMGDLDKDPWIFSYRAANDEGHDSDSDHNSHEQSTESQLWFELDISSRKDTAVYKPNPFSTAKLNAIARSSAHCALRAAPMSLKSPATPENNTGTIKQFFRARQKAIRHSKHSFIPPVSTISKKYSRNHATALIVRQPICPLAAISSPQENSCPDARNHTLSAHILSNDHAHILTKSEFPIQSSASLTHALSSPIIPELPGSKSKPCHSLPASIYATQEETMKSQQSARRPSLFNSSELLSEQEHLIKAEQLIMPVAKPTSTKKVVLKAPASQISCSRPSVSTQILPSNHLNHNGCESRAGATFAPNALRSTQSLLKEPSGARSRAMRCYDFGQNVDEMWSTLPPPKKRVKRRFLLAFYLDTF